MRLFYTVLTLNIKWTFEVAFAVTGSDTRGERRQDYYDRQETLTTPPM